MSRIVDLVEHDLWGIPYPDGSGGPGFVHRVVCEEVCRTAHRDCSHEARLVSARPVDVVEVRVVDLVADRGGGPPVRLESGTVSV